MAKRLSKSRYTTYCQCPKALWLKVYKPDEATVDASVEARFESGNEVGDLAMGLFGPFVEVTTEREDGSLDLLELEATPDMVERYRKQVPGENSVTAWELSGTLREFAPMESRRIWFDYPVHVPDGNNYLAVASYGDSGSRRGKGPPHAGGRRRRGKAEHSGRPGSR